LQNFIADKELKPKPLMINNIVKIITQVFWLFSLSFFYSIHCIVNYIITLLKLVIYFM
jgi:hypothetical protein